MICLSWLECFHWFYFSFMRCSPKPWIFDFSGFLSMSNLDSLEESALESSVNVSFCASLLGYSDQSLWGSTLLSPGSCFFSYRLSGFWRAFARPICPCDDMGSEVLRIGTFCNWQWCPCKFSPCILVSLYSDGECNNGLCPSLWQASLFYPYFLVLCGEYTIK